MNANKDESFIFLFISINDYKIVITRFAKKRTAIKKIR